MWRRWESNPFRIRYFTVCVGIIDTDFDTKLFRVPFLLLSKDAIMLVIFWHIVTKRPAKIGISGFVFLHIELSGCDPAFFHTVLAEVTEICILIISECLSKIFVFLPIISVTIDRSIVHSLPDRS